MIKSIEIKLNLLHKTVVEIMTNGETIGYIVNTDNKEKPHSLVNSKGANVGDFDCPKCAIDAAVRTHFNVGSEYATEFGIQGKPSPKKLLLLALLAMLASDD
ncbi:TPA: hypothetical protein I8438_002302 [Serratia marcescens]|uniref:Uncharacterized protein n=1 Tax=Serratia marcescens TaxID=615 RepID=A0AB33G1Y9_SERMA|nr:MULTISPECIES: hypothetical protein [Serratia]AKL43761.1 hypothetical protein AB188_25990 [Serratia marcescens]AWL71130.1 hypothetical protein DKC05_27515 [Serratia marcescens]UBI64084.1 hypothetical protein GF111_25300 [Serratia sp. HRI]HAT2210478.1 hypothetical protein [Serratia marcescens]HAT2221702.1 hypothetical protein [Serratia marcescens]